MEHHTTNGNGYIEPVLGEDVVLKEKEALTQFLACLPLKAQLGFSALKDKWASRTEKGLKQQIIAAAKTESLKVEYTCLDVTSSTIVIGSSLGIAFLFDRARRKLSKFNCETKQVPVTSIKLLEEKAFIATGQFNGDITLFRYFEEKYGLMKLDLKCTVQHHVQVPVTCIQWTPDGTKLFTADSEGNVAITVINMDEGKTHTVSICKEDSPVVQLSFSHTALLISTLKRTLIWPFNTKKTVQVGMQERKTFGNFGACFHPVAGPVATDDVVDVFAARPGFRIWKATIDGKVLSTMIFKDSINKGLPIIETLDLASNVNQPPQQGEYKQFGPLVAFHDNFVVTWQGSCLWVVDPSTGVVVGCHSNLGCIVDVGINENEIFVLSKGKENFIRRVEFEVNPCIVVEDLDLNNPQEVLKAQRASSVSQFEKDHLDKFIDGVGLKVNHALFNVKSRVKGLKEHIKSWEVSEDDGGSESDRFPSPKTTNIKKAEMNSADGAFTSEGYSTGDERSEDYSGKNTLSTDENNCSDRPFESSNELDKSCEPSPESSPETAIDENETETMEFTVTHKKREQEPVFDHLSKEDFPQDIVFEGTSIGTKSKKKRKKKKDQRNDETTTKPVIMSDPNNTVGIENTDIDGDTDTLCNFNIEKHDDDEAFMTNTFLRVESNESTTSFSKLSPVSPVPITNNSDNSSIDKSRSVTICATCDKSSELNDDKNKINDDSLPTISSPPSECVARLHIGESDSYPTKDQQDGHDNESIRQLTDKITPNENKTTVIDELQNISNIESSHGKVQPENDGFVNRSEDNDNPNVTLIAHNTDTEDETNKRPGQLLESVSSETTRTDLINVDTKVNMENVHGVDHTLAVDSVLSKDDVSDVPQCNGDEALPLGRTLSDAVCWGSKTSDSGLHGKPYANSNHRGNDQGDIELESNNQLHPDNCNQHKLTPPADHTNEPSLSSRTDFSTNDILSENVPPQSFSTYKDISVVGAEKEKENTDMNIVHVKISHQRHGSNVSVASLSERCKEIKGEAIEHNVDRTSPPDLIGRDDTLEGNMHPSQQGLSVVSPRRHSDDSDDDGILYPINPFPPTQVTSIYSQKRVSLSEYSLSHDEMLLEDTEDDEKLLESMMEYDRIDVQNDLIESLDSITDVEDNDGASDADQNNADNAGATVVKRKRRTKKRNSFPSSPSGSDLEGRPTASPKGVTPESLQERLRYLADSWANMNLPNCGQIQEIATSALLVWLIDNVDQVYFSPAAAMSQVYTWKKLENSGRISQIASNVSGTVVWCVDRPNVAYYRIGIKDGTPQGTGWEAFEKNVHQVAVDKDSVWVIKKNGDVFVRTGLSAQRPYGSSWITIKGSSDLVQITCMDGIVWALDIYNHVQVFQGDLRTISVTPPAERELSWTELPGITASHINLGSKAVGWIIDRDNGIWFNQDISRENPSGGNWYQLSLGEINSQDATWFSSILSYFTRGNEPKLIVANEVAGVTILSKQGSVHVAHGHLLGTRWQLAIPSQVKESKEHSCWTSVSAAGADMNKGYIWAMQPNGQLYCFKSGRQSYNVHPPTRVMLKYCTAGPRSLWALTAGQDVYLRLGISETCPQGLKWLKVDMLAQGNRRVTSICAGNHVVWAVDFEGNAWFQMGREDRRGTGYAPAWVSVDGCPLDGSRFVKIVVGPDDHIVWACDDQKNVYARKDVSENFWIGNSWELVPGTSAKDLAISTNHVWCLCPNGDVLCRFGVSSSNVSGDYWKKVPGNFDHISVGANDELWGIDRAGHLYERETMLFYGSTLSHRAPSYNELFSDHNDWDFI